jgi:hypothetical protein
MRLEDGQLVGNPVYPITESQLLKFMPDRYDENGDYVGPAIELSDGVLVLGQAPRDFTVN